MGHRLFGLGNNNKQLTEIDTHMIVKGQCYGSFCIYRSLKIQLKFMRFIDRFRIN